MILEVATLNVRAGEGSAFEQAFSQAQSIISSMPGYISHQLQRCLESQDSISYWCSGKGWRITPLAFVSRGNIKIGKNSCIISMSRFQRWSTMSRCLPPNMVFERDAPKAARPSTLR